ncbi:MAG: type 1 glutamine amidotransferase domain-containing protein [Vulcanimicrobiaceae bacterium]
MHDSKKLDGVRVAILLSEGFEQIEMTEPRSALEAAGARTTLVAPTAGDVVGYNHLDRGDAFPVTATLDSAKPDDFDALLLPGGVANPDLLRTLPKAVAFVSALAKAGKPIAAICHAPWTLLEAGVVSGKTMTSWPSLQTDLRNAGATWVDRSVVVDGTLVTSRNPHDLPDFIRETIAVFAESGARQAPAK